MEPRLVESARARGGIFAFADAQRAGVSPHVLESYVRSGQIVRVRRGAFVLAEALTHDLSDPGRDYLLRARAVLRSRPETDALSHHAALVQHGVAVWGVGWRDIDVASDVERVRRFGLLVKHPLGTLRTADVGGVRCVSVAESLVQVAARDSLTVAVCSMDSALRLGLCDAAELEAACEALPNRGRFRARQAIAAADPCAESVGESRTRLLLVDLGFAVTSQQEIFDRDGFIGRVDFLVDDWVVVEFDGLVKYAGRDGRQALAAEKLRESRLVDAGYEVVRVIWRDLERPAEVAGRIRLAQSRAARRRRDSGVA